MKTTEIIHALQNMDCDACEHDPHCSKGNMCVIIQKACERLALLEKEKEACFRLGQMDMRASMAAKLESAAEPTIGIVRRSLQAAAALVMYSEVAVRD